MDDYAKISIDLEAIREHIKGSPLLPSCHDFNGAMDTLDALGYCGPQVVQTKGELMRLHAALTAILSVM